MSSIQFRRVVLCMLCLVLACTCGTAFAAKKPSATPAPAVPEEPTPYLTSRNESTDHLILSSSNQITKDISAYFDTNITPEYKVKVTSKTSCKADISNGVLTIDASEM